MSPIWRHNFILFYYGLLCPGVCINEDEAGSFSCDCKEGFKGKRCEQRDNCYYIKCQNGGKCVDDDVMGSRCECPPNTGGKFDLYHILELLPSPAPPPPPPG